MEIHSNSPKLYYGFNLPNWNGFLKMDKYAYLYIDFTLYLYM